MTIVCTASGAGDTAGRDDLLSTRPGMARYVDGVLPLHPSDDSSVCTDAGRRGGARGAAGVDHIVEAIRMALSKHWPAIRPWHSGKVMVPRTIVITGPLPL